MGALKEYRNVYEPKQWNVSNNNWNNIFYFIMFNGFVGK
jgi:hypothetical protein